MKHKYETRKELNRIANALELMAYSLSIELLCFDNIDNKLSKIAQKEIDPCIKDGLSSICKNTYYANLRTDEVKEILNSIRERRNEDDEVSPEGDSNK